VTETKNSAKDYSRPGDGDAKPDVAEKSRQRGASWKFSTLLIVLLALAGGYIAWPLWAPQLPLWARTQLAPVMERGRASGAAGRLDELGSRVATLQKNISQLRTDLAGRARIEPQHIAYLSAGLQTLQDRVSAQAAGRADNTSRLAVLEKRLNVAYAALATLDATVKSGFATAARPNGEAAPGVDPESLDRRIRQAVAGIRAEFQLSRSQSEATTADLAREKTTLRELATRLGGRIQALEARPVPVAGAGGPVNLLLVAIGQLREASRGTGDYAASLTSVRSLAGDSAALKPVLDTLARHASSGAPDMAALRARFRTMARDIIAAANGATGTGWVDHTLQRLSRLVTIRRTGEAAAAGDDVDGLVARAELALDAGDLAGAAAALARLSGAPAKAADQWLTGARARLAIEDGIARLFQNAFGRAGGKGVAGG
jgi:hypothetical protein